MNIAERVDKMTPAEINATIAERVWGWEQRTLECWCCGEFGFHGQRPSWILPQGAKHLFLVKHQVMDDYDPYHNEQQAMAALLGYNKRNEWDIELHLSGLRMSVYMVRLHGQADCPYQELGYGTDDGNPAPIISRAIVAAVMQEKGDDGQE